MKNFRRAVILLLMLVTQQISRAQNPTISITSSATNPNICETVTFTVTITNPNGATQALTDPYVGGNFDFTNYYDDPGFTALPGGMHGFQELVSIPVGQSHVLTFDLHLKCNAFNYIISNITGNGNISETITVELFNSSLASFNPRVTNTVSYNIEWSNLVFAPNQFTQDNNRIQSPITRTITVQNNGSPGSHFTGFVTLTDDYSTCNQIAMDNSSFSVSIDNGSGPQQITQGITVLCANGVCTCSVDLSLSGNWLEQGDLLIFTETIILDGCLSQSCGSQMHLDWGCSSTDDCVTTPDQSFVLTQGNLLAGLRCERDAPAACAGCISSPPNLVWESNVTCEGDLQTWTYLFSNVGTENIYSLHVTLETSVNSYVYILDNAVSFADGTASVAGRAIPDPGNIIYLTSQFGVDRPQCLDDNNTALFRYAFDFIPVNGGVAALAPTESFYLTFTTLTCCAEDDDADFRNPGFSAFNREFDFNHWALYVNATNECGDPLQPGEFQLPATTDPEFPMQNINQGLPQGISYNQGPNGDHDLLLVQDFESPWVDIVGTANTCDPGLSIPMQVHNVKFKFDGFDAQYFTNTYNGNYGQMTINGKVKVRIELDRGLELDPLGELCTNPDPTSNTVVIQKEPFVWNCNPVPVLCINDCGLGMNEYEFEFDLANLPNGNTVANFKDFMNDSYIRFNVKPCCCRNPAAPASFCVVKTYMQGSMCTNPGGNCWIPLSEIHKDFTVFCTSTLDGFFGACIPGVLITANSMLRLTTGFADDQNDGVADNAGNDPVDAAFIATHPFVNFNHSIPGDILENTLEATFEDGCGDLDYAHWSACGPRVFDQLYLEQIIDRSNTSQFNITMTACTMSINGGTPFNIFSQVTRGTGIYENEYFYDLPITWLQTIPGLSTYQFTPGDDFQIVSTFQTCQNFIIGNQSCAHDPRLNQNIFDIRVNNRMYFTAAGTPCSFGCFDNGTPAGSCVPCVVACDYQSDWLYFYNTFRSSHRIYSISYNNSTGWMNGAGLSDNSCFKELFINAETCFGGGSANVFPFEFRNSPLLTLYSFNIPAGYTSINVMNDPDLIESPQSASYVRTPDCYPYKQILVRVDQPAVDPTVPVLVPTYLQLNDQAGFPSYNHSCGDEDPCYFNPHCNGNQNLYFGDEYFNHTLFFNLAVPTCEPPSNAVQIDGNEVLMTFDEFGCAPAGTPINSPPQPGGYPILTTTYANLNAQTLLNNQAIGATELCFVIDMTNFNNNDAGIGDASFAFLYSLDPNFQINDVYLSDANGTMGAALPDGGVSIFQLGDIAAENSASLTAHHYFLVCGSFIGCSFGSVTLNYGWSCTDYPLTLNDPICDDNTVSFTCYPQGITLSYQADGEYSLCNPASSMHIQITSSNYGGAKDFVIDVDFLSTANIANVFDATVEYNGVAFGTPITPTSSQSVWTFDLTPLANAYGIDEVLSKPDANTPPEVLDIYFTFEPTCEFSVTPDIVIHSNKFCGGANIDGSIIPSPWIYDELSNVCQPCGPCELTITFTTTEADCLLPNGEITANVSGGAQPYTYSWSNAQSGPTITGLVTGIYTVDVTDANGCIVSASVPLGSSNMTAIITGHTDATCENGEDGTATVLASGGTLPYTYLWSPAGGTGATATGLAPGTYIVRVEDYLGCVEYATVTIGYIYPAPSVDLGPDLIVCDGWTVTLDAGFGFDAYLWSDNSTNQTLPVTVSGTYGVVVTDINGCQNSDMADVAFVSCGPIQTFYISPFCYGSNDGSAWVTVNSGTPPYDYLWSTGETDYITTGLTAGTYTCTITDANGYTASVTVVVPDIPKLVLNPSSTDVLCFGDANGTASAGAQGGTAPYTYLWSNTEVTSTITGLTAGTYFCTVTDAHGCTYIASVDVNEPAELSVTGKVIKVSCHGGSDGSAEVLILGGTAPYQVLWSNSETTTTINNLAAGTYTCTVTDANQCTASVIVTVTEPAQISIFMVMTTACPNNGSARATPSGGVLPFTYLWSNGGATSGITGLSAGTYTVTVTDANNCTASATVAVTSCCQPVVTGPANTCTGAKAKLQVTNCQLTAVDTWVWYTGSCGGTMIGTGGSISVSPVVTTTYYVWSVDPGGNQTSLCASFTITVSPVAPSTPSAISGAGSICLGVPHTFSTSSTNAVSYNWSVNNASTTGYSCNTSSCTMTFTSIGGGATVCATATNACGTSAPRCNGIANGITVLCCGITGQENCLCGLSNVTYTTTAATNSPTGYTWAVTSVNPSGSVTLGASNTNSVQVSYGSNFISCVLSVYATNACGNSVTRTLTLFGTPAKPYPIVGTTPVCPGDDYTFSTSGSCPGATYTWSVPNGCSINSGQGTTSISVHWGNNNGSVTVYATNGCGNSSGRSYAVTVQSCKQTTGINPDVNSFQVVPNPSDGRFIVHLNAALKGNMEITIHDHTGRIVRQRIENVKEGENQFEFDLSDLAKGIYYIDVILNDEKYRNKLVIQ